MRMRLVTQHINAKFLDSTTCIWHHSRNLCIQCFVEFLVNENNDEDKIKDHLLVSWACHSRWGDNSRFWYDWELHQKMIQDFFLWWRTWRWEEKSRNEWWGIFYSSSLNLRNSPQCFKKLDRRQSWSNAEPLMEINHLTMEVIKTNNEIGRWKWKKMEWEGITIVNIKWFWYLMQD